MKPEKSGSSGGIVRPPTDVCGAGGAEYFRKPSSKSCTPKLFAALPKKTGDNSPASTAAGSKAAPAISSISISSRVFSKVASSSRSRTMAESSPPISTGAR
jgi:hypothetical protein